MSKLDDFLGLTDVSEVRKVIPINVGGTVLEITIKPVSEEEHSEFQKRCQVFNKNKMTFDTAKYNNLILESCIVEPNFSSEEFLRKAKCQTASEFINKKFPAGVVSDIAIEIQKLSGFDSYEMEVENAKN